jgi:hypothetical protein
MPPKPKFIEQARPERVIVDNPHRDDDLPLCTNQPVEKLSESELRSYIEAWERAKARYDSGLKQIKAHLLSRKATEIKALLAEKAEPFGDVTITVGNGRAKVNVPKKVTWDNAALAKKYGEVKESGENPEMYFKVEYAISETAYKSWPEEVRSYFEDARTVEQGNPTIKFIEERGE